MNFIDSAKIWVKAGSGGGGCNSVYRDKYTRHPRPDGGDGGAGGNIVLRADKSVFTLYSFKFRQHFTAASGGHGSSNKKKGCDAPDKVVLVPPGTAVIDVSTESKLRDLLFDGQELVVAKGGRGGSGSAHRKIDDFKGEAGEEKELALDLKLIADVGLVGFPNSGKSTLISKITNARPKIASYPFTTKAPCLGVRRRDENIYSIADIPGLIEGSHQGKGLGLSFLRHVERTKILVQMIDMAGVDGRSPIDDYRIICNELRLYGGEVFKKPRILVANKMDLTQAQVNLQSFRRSVKEKIIPVSALEEKGLKGLINAIERRLFANSG